MRVSFDPNPQQVREFQLPHWYFIVGRLSSRDGGLFRKDRGYAAGSSCRPRGEIANAPKLIRYPVREVRLMWKDTTGSPLYAAKEDDEDSNYTTNTKENKRSSRNGVQAERHWTLRLVALACRAIRTFQFHLMRTSGRWSPASYESAVAWRLADPCVPGRGLLREAGISSSMAAWLGGGHVFHV